MAPTDHAPGFRGIKFNWDWVTRPLFGIALIALVVAALVYGAPYVALFGAICISISRIPPERKSRVSI